jgi:hypothetical protein
MNHLRRIGRVMKHRPGASEPKCREDGANQNEAAHRIFWIRDLVASLAFSGMRLG